MVTIRKYVKAGSLGEAWKLNKVRANRVLGGMGWMKMEKGTVPTAIDLSGLGLDQIQETEEEFIIGAMVTLRQLETNAGFNVYFKNAAKECLRHIVGVQFRNCATLGGSLWLRPGFSDPITLLLALDTSIELYVGQEETITIPLDEFCRMKKDNSILVAIHVKKDGRKVSYTSLRNTETDFPVLAVAVSRTQSGYTASIGARPKLATRVEAESLEELVRKAQQLNYEGNIRGSEEYRRAMAEVLVNRAAAAMEMGQGEVHVNRAAAAMETSQAEVLANSASAPIEMGQSGNSAQESYTDPEI